MSDSEIPWFEREIGSLGSATDEFREKPKSVTGYSSSLGVFAMVAFEHAEGVELVAHSFIDGASANADFSRITVHSARCVVVIEGENLRYILDQIHCRQLDRVSLGEGNSMRVDRIIVHRG